MYMCMCSVCVYLQRQVETETFATLDLWIPQAVSGTGSTVVLLVLAGLLNKKRKVMSN